MNTRMYDKQSKFPASPADNDTNNYCIGMFVMYFMTHCQIPLYSLIICNAKKDMV